MLTDISKEKQIGGFNMIDTFSLLQKYTGISKYSQSEVITPQNIVSDMVDLLPQEVFNPDATFFDPAVKSGRFLIEIYNRLMASPLLAHIPESDRHNHIIEKQLFGFATSPTAATVVRKTLYNDPLAVGNIRFAGGNITKELVQGAFNSMKFDVVIGNPPYNKGMDIDFVNLGFELSTKYCVMIVPAKWQTADANQKVASKMSYGDFRNKFVPHIKSVNYFPDSYDLFDIKAVDGITYFIIDKNTVYETTTVTNSCNIQPVLNSSKSRSLKDGVTLWNIGAEILESLGKYEKFSIPYQTTGRFWVNVNTQASPGGGGFATKELNDTGKYVTKAGVVGNGGMLLSPNKKNIPVIGKIQLIDSSNPLDVLDMSGTCCVVYRSDSIDECRSFISFLQAKLVRFLILINLSKLTIIDDTTFRYVPNPPSGKFDHIYTDDELYKDFNLPQKYIDVIEAIIRERK